MCTRVQALRHAACNEWRHSAPDDRERVGYGIDELFTSVRGTAESFSALHSIDPARRRRDASCDIDVADPPTVRAFRILLGSTLPAIFSAVSSIVISF